MLQSGGPTGLRKTHHTLVEKLRRYMWMTVLQHIHSFSCPFNRLLVRERNKRDKRELDNLMGAVNNVTYIMNKRKDHFNENSMRKY
jgi:hypothetical protein